ncbi:STAS-like domain-containing protein [Arcticibacter svalbardensis]|uniref:STAS-like domain-containing protein n=1 Tax=Arcticibacter svalbardensis TaxID=1288027 RepID=UPI00058F388E|nr:STAS-like domain-containing protein [Arcticibacter svalbardensis]
MKINVTDILNSSNASLHDDGIRVYTEIKKHLGASNKEEIEVDFSNIKRCSTLFLNASFGKLLADYGEELVKKLVHPRSYSQILNFNHKYSDMFDNFVNKDNYQAYREEALA